MATFYRLKFQQCCITLYHPNLLPILVGTVGGIFTIISTRGSEKGKENSYKLEPHCNFSRKGQLIHMNLQQLDLRRSWQKVISQAHKLMNTIIHFAQSKPASQQIHSVTKWEEGHTQFNKKATASANFLSIFFSMARPHFAHKSRCATHYIGIIYSARTTNLHINWMVINFNGSYLVVSYPSHR